MRRFTRITNVKYTHTHTIYQALREHTQKELETCSIIIIEAGEKKITNSKVVAQFQKQPLVKCSPINFAIYCWQQSTRTCLCSFTQFQTVRKNFIQFLSIWLNWNIFQFGHHLLRALCLYVYWSEYIFFLLKLRSNTNQNKYISLHIYIYNKNANDSIPIKSSLFIVYVRLFSCLVRCVPFVVAAKNGFRNQTSWIEGT